MTGRDLIIYILENDLENKEIFKDGKIPGLLTFEEAAVKFSVGPATIKAWADYGYLEEVGIYDQKYIPVTAELNIKGGNDEK